MLVKITRSDIIWNYSAIFTNVTINFVILIFILFFLNDEEIGLWYVFLNVGMITTLFDLGFNAALSRNIAYSWSGAQSLSKEDVCCFVPNGQHNIFLLKKISVTCRIIYAVIASFALLMLLTAGYYYVGIVAQGISGNKHIIAWFIYSFAVFLNLFYGYYTALLKGVGAIAQNSKATVIAKIFHISAAFFLLYLGESLLALSVSYFISCFVYRFIARKYFLQYEKIGQMFSALTEKITWPDIKEVFSAIFYNAWREGIIIIANFLATNFIITLASLYFSLAQTGLYAICLQIVQITANIASAMYTSFQPALQNLYLANNMQKSKEIYSLCFAVFVFIYLLLVFLVLSFGAPIINMIKPSINFDRSFFACMALYYFIFQTISLSASFISNSNRLPYLKAFIISSITGSLLAIAFINYTEIGIYSLIAAPLLAQLAYNAWKWPAVVSARLHTSQGQLLKNGWQQMKKLIRQKISVH